VTRLLMLRHRFSRSRRRMGAGKRQQDLKEKAGQARDIGPLAGQVSGK
jgi:hypothetical protein